MSDDPIPTLLGWALAIYIGGTLMVGAWGAIAYFEPVNKRLGARLILSCPVWPVALPVLFGREIGRGIGQLWKEATRR